MDCQTLGRTDLAACDLAALARDPLVRLVMASDGVSEAEFVAVLRSAQRAMWARGVPSGRDTRAARRGTDRAHVIPMKARRGARM